MASQGERGDIDFSAFVISLGSNVMLQLDPSSELYDVGLARQTIDILAMLEHKTAGNLTSDEADLLRGLLYQTRLAWAEANRTAPGAATTPDKR
jgi:hypothetical protein